MDQGNLGLRSRWAPAWDCKEGRPKNGRACRGRDLTSCKVTELLMCVNHLFIAGRPRVAKSMIDSELPSQASMAPAENALARGRENGEIDMYFHERARF